MLSTASAMMVVFAVYALTFFFMGGVIWYRLGQTSRLGLVAPLLSMIVFSFVHGAADLLEVVIRIPGLSERAVVSVTVVKLVLLAASFVFLFLFGAAVFLRGSGAVRLIYIVGLVALVGIVAGVAVALIEGAASGSFLRVNVGIRTFVGIPAGLLASAAFATIAQRCHRLGIRQSRDGAIVAGAATLAYTLLAAIIPAIRPELTVLVGMPIQVHRMFAALGITAGVVWMLERMTVQQRPE